MGLQLAQNWLTNASHNLLFEGFGLYDMDMVLPVEVRFGRYITDRWYIMGELTYHFSLAGETACLEPAIRVGCNFGRKIKGSK